MHIASVQSAQNRIKPDSTALIDSPMLAFIKPYKLKLDSQMQEVLVYTETELIKERPEGTLCNLVTDAMLDYGRKNSDKVPVASIMNYGGVRLPSIAAGDITLGKAYELMPFDNMLMVAELEGTTLTKLLNAAAKTGGWPVSGIRYSINNSIAEDIFIGNEKLDLNKKYWIVLSDYLLQGGDGMDMLKGAPSHPLNYKVRDAIVEYLRNIKNNNQQLHLEKDGRARVIQPEKIH
jgi:2',3'-cyclic-nucleotide 2'-phosphodiesterase (5'-nucleotidase family)